jgi:hypothetical protein
MRATCLAHRILLDNYNFIKQKLYFYRKDDTAVHKNLTAPFVISVSKARRIIKTKDFPV